MFAFLLAVFHTHTCDHDAEQDKVLRNAQPSSLISPVTMSGSAINITDRKPLRIYFDMSSIDDATKDTNQCTATSSSCQSTDILTDTKRAAIKQTISNIESLLSGLLNVTRVDGDNWSVTCQSDLSGITVNSTIYNYDLYIPVVAEPYGSSSTTLATAVTLQRDSLGRANVGKINLNPSQCPTTAENASSGDRQFFTTVLHELNHVLSFSSSHFGKWINVSTGSTYSSAVTSLTNTYGLTMQWVSTPYLTSWVNDRFNVISTSLNTFGLELEDGGGSGTANSHPTSRLYFTDLMQGVTYGPAWISPILFNSLIDSGWYTMNSTRRAEIEEELVWLDVARNDPSEYVSEDIILESGWKEYPDFYRCTDTTTTFCFYDQTAKGSCATNTSSIDSYTPSSWYNPDNLSTVGKEELLDFVPTLLPTSFNCRDVNTPSTVRKISGLESYDETKFAETYGTSSMCAMSTVYSDGWGGFITSETASCFSAWCGTDYRPRFTIKGKTFFCREDGLKFTVPWFPGYVVCPPGRAACANMPKVQVVNAMSIYPDRGPSEGKNLVAIRGYGFSDYTNLSFMIGSYNLTILESSDEEILCSIPEIPSSERSALNGVPQTLHAIVGENTSLNTDLDGMYTFTERSYSGASMRFVPALVIMVASVIVALFA